MMESPNAPVDNALEVRNLEVVYNKVQVAVRGVSLAVERGSIVTVLGPNGAGKSTLLRAISGFMSSENGRVTEGEVIVNGKSVVGLSPESVVAHGIALMPQEQAIFPGLSVNDNLKVVPFPGGEAERQEVLAHIFELFPRLKERRKQVAGYMSGGERKMLAISRLLLLRPQVMLVDELSFGLAPLVFSQLVSVLKDINKESGTSILLVEQNAAVALTIADRAYIMETGQVVFEGSAEDLHDNPRLKELYLGLSEESGVVKYSELRPYRRARRWGG